MTQFGYVPWPPNFAFVESLLGRHEDSLLDFKRECDFESGNGKAEFAKDVLSLANAVSEGHAGLLAIGFDEIPSGSKIIGVASTKGPEAIIQILAQHTDPVPDLRVQHFKHPQGTVCLAAVFWSPLQPHYAIREVTGVLRKDAVYYRRDRTNGTLTPQEHRTLILAAQARIRAPISLEPLQVGCVDIGAVNYSTLAVFRIQNVIDEPVSGVSVIIDIALRRNPNICNRARKITGATFNAGYSQEVQLVPADLQFYENGKYLGDHHTFTSSHGNRWFDVTVHVQYRDKNGFIKEITDIVTLAE
jgi:hypothetical protein